ncbi:MAG: phospholipase D-like domain-containing protein [Terriglobia bacterium]
MKLLIQPADGVAPVVHGINAARQRIDVVVFRLDHPEVERALENAVAPGVAVRALIAYTNRGGEENLRKLEMRLLASGISVARTDNVLVRYHGKFLIVDDRILYLLGFNFTYQDINHSRSFGIVTRDHKLVQEAARLFEADLTRHPFTPLVDQFVVSPINARRRLARFIKSAKTSLLIYDLRLSDAEMLRLLQDRAKAGVRIRAIGSVTRRHAGFEVRALARLRLHVRVMIRDRVSAFIGSQSLRALELDARREVGVVFRNARVISSLTRIFESDWRSGIPEHQPAKGTKGERRGGALSARKTAKQIAETVVEQLPPVCPVLQDAVETATGRPTDAVVDSAGVEKTIKKAVEGAIRETVREVIKEATE